MDSASWSEDEGEGEEVDAGAAVDEAAAPFPPFFFPLLLPPEIRVLLPPEDVPLEGAEVEDVVEPPLPPPPFRRLFEPLLLPFPLP